MEAAQRTRVHVFVTGTVQGVWFRQSTRDEAVPLGVAGWVRNLRDGRVEAVFEGTRFGVEHMVQWCHEGPPAARVRHVESHAEAIDRPLDGFEVRR